MEFGVVLLECRRINAAEVNANVLRLYSKLHSTLTSKLTFTLVTHMLLPERVT
jgi:hypothetical protein